MSVRYMHIMHCVIWEEMATVTDADTMLNMKH